MIRWVICAKRGCFNSHVKTIAHASRYIMKFIKERGINEYLFPLVWDERSVDN